MWSYFVVEVEELLEGVKPPALLVIGLEEAFDLSIRLRPSNLAEGMFDPMLVEKAFEFMIETGPFLLASVDEL